jgi:hypothetical protein
VDFDTSVFQYHRGTQNDTVGQVFIAALRDMAMELAIKRMLRFGHLEAGVKKLVLTALKACSEISGKTDDELEDACSRMRTRSAKGYLWNHLNHPNLKGRDVTIMLIDLSQQLVLLVPIRLLFCHP